MAEATEDEVEPRIDLVLQRGLREWRHHEQVPSGFRFAHDKAPVFGGGLHETFQERAQDLRTPRGGRLAGFEERDDRRGRHGGMPRGPKGNRNLEGCGRPGSHGSASHHRGIATRRNSHPPSRWRQRDFLTAPVSPRRKREDTDVAPAPVADPLIEAFRQDLRCRIRDAARLAARARASRLEIGEAEDSDEDLVTRLRDPRTFGDFAAQAIRDSRLLPSTRVRLAERAFDLLPVPDTESEVLVVEGRAPRSLLRLVEFLGSHRALTSVQVLHTVYAVFLDRSLVTESSPGTRARALAWMAVAAGAVGNPVLVYAAMHLAVVPPIEAVGTLGQLLRSRRVPDGLKVSLAELAAAEDGGARRWTEVAKTEGLLAADADPDSPAGIATTPRLEERVRHTARRWLARRRPTP